MGHNLGKQAALAVAGSETKAAEKLTPEQLIQALRSNLRANPPVGAYVPNHQIQALLVAYDAEKEFSHKLAEECFAVKTHVAELLDVNGDLLRRLGALAEEKQVMVETILGLTQTIQKLQTELFLSPEDY